MFPKWNLNRMGLNYLILTATIPCHDHSLWFTASHLMMIVCCILHSTNGNTLLCAASVGLFSVDHEPLRVYLYVNIRGGSVLM